MAPSDWLIPDVTTETEFRWRAYELEIHRVAKTDPERVAKLTVLLLKQAQMQESILGKAVQRIAGLEAEMRLASRGDLPGLQPRPWWRPRR